MAIDCAYSIEGSGPVLFLDCPWLKDDAVFCVKESLIADFKSVDDPKRAADLGLPNPFREVVWNVVLSKA